MLPPAAVRLHDPLTAHLNRSTTLTRHAVAVCQNLAEPPSLVFAHWAAAKLGLAVAAEQRSRAAGFEPSRL